MAGSIKWFEYETDDGGQYAVSMDESNGEAVSNIDYSATSTATMKLPRNVQPRQARYVSADGLYSRTIIVGTAGSSLSTLPATISGEISGSATPVTLSITSFTGERFTAIPRAADTALLDGDAT